MFRSLTNLKDFAFKQRCWYKCVVQDMYFCFYVSSTRKKFNAYKEKIGNF